MQVPLQIAFHNLDRSEDFKALIEEKVAWLERSCDRITGCRVVVEEPHRRHHQGHQWLVRIDLVVPGGEVVVNREAGPHARGLDGTIREAFEVARRRLEGRARRRARR